MAITPAPPTNPFLFNQPIVDEKGMPTPYFLRQWDQQFQINLTADEVAAALGVVETDIAAVRAIDLIAGNGIDGGGDLSNGDRTFSLTDPAYDIVAFLPGEFADSQLLMQLVFDRTVNFADDFAGSTGLVGTNPTSAATIDIKQGVSSIGTISITTGGAVTFVTSGGAPTFVSGDKLSLINQVTADATLADVSIALKGTRTF